jgi:hypothetical protein
MDTAGVAAVAEGRAGSVHPAVLASMRLREARAAAEASANTADGGPARSAGVEPGEASEKVGTDAASLSADGGRTAQHAAAAGATADGHGIHQQAEAPTAPGLARQGPKLDITAEEAYAALPPTSRQLHRVWLQLESRE